TAASPPAAPTAEVPASASFEAQSRASGYQTSFYVLGFVKNTSPFTIDKPKVTAVLRDATGKEVATRDGYAEGEVLLPQASAPVKVLVSDPPKHERITFEGVATKASYLPEDSAGLRFEILEAPHSTGSGWEVTGKVFNEGKQASRFVNILVLAFDAKEQLVGLDSTYVDGEAIAPGASARFRAMPLYDAPPHHFKYLVSGRAQK
ncbi:MAG: FxLYD domain-containing protein, partial [Polyangiaceae bacterium]